MMANKEHEELLAAVREVVEASNRTNHAVRAIVLPSTIMLFALVIALPFVLLSFAVSLIMLVIPVGFIVGGAILAIIAQLRETSASEIPGEANAVKSKFSTPPSVAKPPNKWEKLNKWERF